MVHTSKTHGKLFHDECNPTSIADVLISYGIKACYTASPTQHLYLYNREEPLILFYIQLALRTKEDNRSDEITVNFSH